MTEKLLRQYPVKSFEEMNRNAVKNPGQYEEIGARIGALVDKKNAAYGNSIHDAGHVMRILYPKGISPEQMDDALALVRILDKMFRIANKKNAFGENPFEDIAGYGILKCREKSPHDRGHVPEARRDRYVSPESGGAQ